jgi:hypothetical protein
MVIGPVHYALQACLPKYGGLQLFFIDVPFISDFKSYVMVFLHIKGIINRMPASKKDLLASGCHS